METNLENILLQMILAIEEGRIQDYLKFREIMLDIIAKDKGMKLRLVKSES